MSILKIARMGHPVLRSVAEPVVLGHVSDPEIQNLIRDMIETLQDSGGVGLAAPQVHHPLRIALVAPDPKELLVLINPEVTYLTTSMIRSFEGCLSIPEIRAAVDRIERLKVRAWDAFGNPFEREFTGFPAIVIQHECDHLDGMLFIDRCLTRSLAFTEEARRYGPLDGALGNEDPQGQDSEHDKRHLVEVEDNEELPDWTHASDPDGQEAEESTDWLDDYDNIFGAPDSSKGGAPPIAEA